jgi:hypothetical protein
MAHIPTDYYEKQFKLGEELTTKAAEKILSFWQHILLVSSSIDGILISLHAGNSESLYIRLAFFLSTILLTTGVISTSIVVFDHSMLPERGRQKFVQEARDACQEDRKLNPVFVNKKRRTVICERLSSISLISALFLMLAYTFLKEYPL